MKKKSDGLPFEIDSAGTAGYHSGDLPDPRMRSHARKRGYILDSRARRFNPSVDFEKYDFIIAMDKENLRDVKRMDQENRYGKKLSLMTEYCTRHDEEEVPDPYYEGPEGFEHVLDILEDACDGLLNKLSQQGLS